MDWLLSIVRIAGVSFPGAASLVQLQAEVDMKALSDRVSRLEDPISNLHDDIPLMSRKIYEQIRLEDKATLEFEDAFYESYSRPLAALESQGCIEGHHTIGHRYTAGITLIDPSYIMYMCALAEDGEKMESLIRIVDKCEIGKWLDGKEIRKSVDLPLPVIKAVFEIFESKGIGFCSDELGACQYMGTA
jgi:hypothetical protein